MNADSGNICKDIKKDKCTLTRRNLEFNNENITDDLIDQLQKRFTLEFNYTENHVTLYENDKYSILFYKNENCISNLSLEFSQINLENCYSQVQSHYSIVDDKIVIGLVYSNNFVNNNRNKKNHVLNSLNMYDPNYGDKLNISDMCGNEQVIVQEDLMNKLMLSSENNPQYISQLLKQDVDIFNLEDKFYTDICYKFESPINRDVSLKDRALIFYPNITLCDEKCVMKGVDPNTMKAKCECRFNDILNNDFLSNNMWYKSQMEEITQLFTGTNLIILKCFKEFFKYKYFINSIGSYIIMGIIFIKIIMTIIYCPRFIYSIKKYIFSITEEYITYLNRHKNLNAPKKKSKSNSKKFMSQKTSDTHIISNKKEKEKDSYNIEIKDKFSKINNNSSNNSSSLEKINPSNHKKSEKKEKKISEKVDKKMEEYLLSDLDDLVFEDAIIRDNRKFIDYFIYKLKANLLIVDIILNRDQFKPFPLKIILLVLNLEIYLVINAFFFNEELIGEIYHSENENKYSFISRTFNRIFYIIVAIFTYNNIIECFFINENKIQAVFKRQKDNILFLKSEVYQILRKTIKRFNIFIIVSFIISILSFYYISCFNNIYPKTEMEWIKSSILVILFMTVIIILTIFLESVLRHLALYIKSDKLYKLSLIVAEINNK